MRRLLRWELIKLQGTGLYPIAVYAGIAGAGVCLLLTKVQARYGMVPIWSDYFLTALTLVGGMLAPVILGLMASFVWGREFTDGTAPWMRMSGFGSSRVIVAKQLVILILGLLIAVSSIVAELIMGQVVGLQGFYWEIVRQMTFAQVTSIVIAWFGATWVSVMVCVFHNQTVPMAFATVTGFSGFLLKDMHWATYVPWTLPARYATLVAQSSTHDPTGALRVLNVPAVMVGLTGIVVTAVVLGLTEIRAER